MQGRSVRDVYSEGANFDNAYCVSDGMSVLKRSL